MLNVMECQAAEFTDVDAYRDSGAETLRATQDKTWMPPLPLRGDICPVRAVLYLIEVEAGAKLRESLKVEVSPTEDGAFQLHSPFLDISGIGENLMAAKTDLCDTIMAFWEEFSKTPSDRLAPESTVILRRLRSILG
jgi:hypothetical protein